MKYPKTPLYDPIKEAAFRFQVVSQVLLREHDGELRSKAIKSVTACRHLNIGGEFVTVKKGKIKKWLDLYETFGPDGLLPASRKSDKASVVIEEDLLDFFKTQKVKDPGASVPELIKRAKELGMIKPGQEIDRVTVWRSLIRMGVDTTRRKFCAKTRDCRRFAYPHRMNMVLCDGKHFRAGVNRLRRVAFFYLDDATRLALNVKVGTSETAQLFLQGLYETLLFYGRMDSMFVDNGSGFIATDSIDVLRKLGILFIHGTAGYPQGRAKVERFNRTADEQCMRYFPGNPEVDQACSALELRLRHYLFEVYNHTPHTSLDGLTPWDRFHNDDRPLRFFESQDQLRQFFVLHHERRVSFDNVVSFDGEAYEVPIGHAGSRIMLFRNVLKDALSINHENRLVALSPVDLCANAHDKRCQPKSFDVDGTGQILPKGSTQLVCERDLKPVVDMDGGFPQSDKKSSKPK